MTLIQNWLLNSNLQALSGWLSSLLSLFFWRRKGEERCWGVLRLKTTHSCITWTRTTEHTETQAYTHSMIIYVSFTDSLKQNKHSLLDQIKNHIAQAYVYARLRTVYVWNESIWYCYFNSEVECRLTNSFEMLWYDCSLFKPYFRLVLTK